MGNKPLIFLIIAYFNWYFVFIVCKILIHVVFFLEIMVCKQLHAILKKIQNFSLYSLHIICPHMVSTLKINPPMKAFKRGIVQIS